MADSFHKSDFIFLGLGNIRWSPPLNFTINCIVYEVPMVASLKWPPVYLHNLLNLTSWEICKRALDVCLLNPYNIEVVSKTPILSYGWLHLN